MPIQNIPNVQSLTIQQIADFLDENVVERKSADPMLPDSAWATGARGLRDFTPLVWEQMVAEIRTMGLNETANQIGSGMDYGDPATIAMIDTLADSKPQVFTPERVAILKSWGTNTRKRYLDYGYSELPSVEQIEAELEALNAEPQEADETKHEVLLSVNRGTDGEIRVMARITPVEFVEGVELRRGEVQTLVNDAALVAALNPIIQGLING